MPWRAGLRRPFARQPSRAQGPEPASRAASSTIAADREVVDIGDHRGRGAAPVEQARVEPAGAHVGIGQHRAQLVDVGVEPEQDGLREQRVEPGERLVAVGAERDRLGEHRVVVAADDEALDEPAVEAEPLTRGLLQREHGSRGRQEIAGRGLGVDAGLDRVP